ncbi:hypothetical protein BJY01DRAFT_233137 [Aspergillus pseudoustus]|uniref:NAD(P)-binding protein n=1 Tax=Aspergillus pseudoustus TaxID=1810923 RepID=A0ABR4KES3_9EURO
MSLVSCISFQLSGRYADRNRWGVLNGPGDWRGTAEEIIYDEGLLDAWNAKTVLFTGVSSGIGVETVRVLALAGATVYGSARNLEKTRDALGEEMLRAGQVHLLVRPCAEGFRGRSDRRNDGFELQFGTNHLSHFAPFWYLKDLLLASSTPAFHSRVVNVASVAHRYSPVQFDNNSVEGNYNGWLTCGSSKTANIYMATQVERLYGSRGLHGYSVHPGGFTLEGDERAQRYLTKNPQASATSVYGAVTQELEGRGGMYLEGPSIATRACPEDGDAVEYGFGKRIFLIVTVRRDCGS